MSNQLNTNIQQVWNHFLQEVLLAKNYHMPYLLTGFGHTFHNPLLEYLLPSLLYVKMVTILDEALILFIINHNLKIPKKYQNSLYGRIEYLHDKSRISNYSSLHNIRNLRNLLAHEASKTTTWNRLNTYLNIVENELQYLNLVGNRPDYQYFGERSAMQESDDPDILLSQNFRFGIKQNDHVTMEIAFTQKTHSNNG